MDRLALGYCLSRKYLFDGFNLKKIHKIENKRTVIANIFVKFLDIMLKDVVRNNIAFRLPIKSDYDYKIYVKVVETEDFKYARQRGALQGIDYLVTNFKGYNLVFDRYKSGLDAVNNKSMHIYTTRKLKQELLDNINSGMIYSERNIKTIYDYIDVLYKIDDTLTKEELILILTYGWKRYIKYYNLGIDICIIDKNFFFYNGKLSVDSLKHYLYYVSKLKKKIRYLYNKRDNSNWDGYYYFVLSDDKYKEYLSQIHVTGPKRKIFKLGKIRMYKSLEECMVDNGSKSHFFKKHYGIDLSMLFLTSGKPIKDFEYMYELEGLGWKTINRWKKKQ